MRGMHGPVGYGQFIPPMPMPYGRMPPPPPPMPMPGYGPMFNYPPHPFGSQMRPPHQHRPRYSQNRPRNYHNPSGPSQ